MKIFKLYFLTICLSLVILLVQAQKTYVIISGQKSKINKNIINELPSSLKGLAAYYSAIGGTICKEGSCALTTSLGMGKQGSAEQKNLIKKYFLDDKVAGLLISQDCYLPSDSSASYSNFKYLKFTVYGERIEVNYTLSVFDHGNTKFIKGPDIYKFQNETFKEKK